ncbi:ABC transporter permease [Dyadobacter endophyticus]|uniref:ABC transporter permease n=1 Tax=Dyadobacter endophyticus TaxID=1749036 RepID=A0ABQ1YDN2_9BACT|nr:ABC transporter permease [Dyadobacter endophyticus]GGH22247.1 ABC transporter permease [Dyadobacter endophyticus]
MNTPIQPPRWATRLLHWFCASHLVNDLEGDLLELFAQRVRTHGPREARRRYVRDVISLIRPFTLKEKPEKYPQPAFIQSAMIRNFFKIAFRNLVKHKLFSFINVLGLSAGMTACFLIALYVHFELTYDAFNKKADRIYRLSSDIQSSAGTLQYSITSWPFGPALQNDFPEIEAFTRVSKENYLFRKGDVKFNEENTVLADSSIFQVFDLKLLQGNPKTALKAPFSVVLTESAAKKYFGAHPAMGQTLLVGDNGDAAQVTGIMQDPPVNSQLRGDVFLSMTTHTRHYNTAVNDEWGNFGTTTYLLLQPGTDPAALSRKFPAFLHNHMGRLLQQENISMTLLLEPLRDIYLYSKREAEQSGSIENIYIFTIVAIFILLIACINFINLTTARSLERAREVGVRKAVGAGRWLLARQFIAESLLMSFLGFLLSVILSAALLPLFNELSGKTISRGLGQEPLSVGILFLASIFIGLASGIYPALVLSSFEPVKVLKGKLAMTGNGAMLRKGLVTIQFAISIALIIGTMIVYSQLDFMRSHALGFAKDQTVVIKPGTGNSRNALKTMLQNVNGVKSVAGSSAVPGGPNSQAHSKLENARGEMQIATLDVYRVDFDFIPQYGLKVVAGRPFSSEFTSDSTKALVVNEATVKLLGYHSPREAIGKKFSQWDREGTIVGVVKDFNFKSLKENVKPLTFRMLDPWNSDLLSVKLDGHNVKATLEAIETQWKTQYPDRPFSYYFLDEFYDRQYRADERFEALFLNFAALAIFISCMGLLGLASYATVQRTKEIGVRKVLGASVASIVGLLSKDFLQLVGLAFVIAAPLAWFVMHRWLESFAYKTPIHLWIFLAAALLSALVALATISFQSIRAALVNPVKSLRSE